MAAEEQTYSIDEIEAETGYPRRTVAYYVRLGLLPSVGQRGAKTRYSQHFLDRLLFLKEIRRRQDMGKFPPLSLEEIRDRVLANLSPEVIGRMARGEEGLEAIALSVGDASDEVRAIKTSETRFAAMLQAPTYDARRSVARSTEVSPESSAALAAKVMQGQAKESELSGLLLRLTQALEEDRVKRGDKPGEWTTVEVTEDVLLSVRSKKRKVVKAVEKVGKVLRELVGG